MSAVSMTYILMAKEGFKLGSGIAYPVGIVFALSLFTFYAVHCHLFTETLFHHHHGGMMTHGKA
jgi:hypothetical protein